MEYKEPKFKPEDQVELEGEVCTVVEIMFKDEWVYKVTSKEVDIERKEIINGFKFATESELKPVKEQDDQ